MDLGTGIFLGSCVIAFVLLFNSTKDRWRWNRIILWMVLILTISVGLGFGIDALVGWYEGRPRALEPVREYWGLKLGMSEDDVLFVKGRPGESTTSAKGTRIYFYHSGDYSQAAYFFCGKLYAIGGSGKYSEVLYGLRPGDGLEVLLAKLGEPEDVRKNDEDRTARLYSYKRLNADYSIKAGVVEALWLTAEKDKSCVGAGEADGPKVGDGPEGGQGPWEESHSGAG